MFYNANTNKNYFKTLLKEYLQNITDEEFYFCPIEFYEYLLNNEQEYNKYDFETINNNLVSVIEKSNYFGLDVIELHGDYKDDIYKKLIKEYPNYIVASPSYYPENIDKFYNIANLENADKDLYLNDYHYNFLLPKTMDQNIILNKIEQSINNFDKSKIIYKYIDIDEFYKIIRNKYKDNIFSNGFIRNCNNQHHLSGFCYASLNEPENTKLLVAFLNDDPVGIIKCNIYNNYGNIKHYGLAYIDVHKKYRNKGIATMMIKELNKYLTNDIPLFLTQESDMGKQCHMQKLFLENITATACVPYNKQEQYYYNNIER